MSRMSRQPPITPSRLGLEHWAKDLSVLGHHLDVVGSPAWKPLAVQAVIGLLGTTIGLPAYTRRGLPA